MTWRAAGLVGGQRRERLAGARRVHDPAADPPRRRNADETSYQPGEVAVGRRAELPSVVDRQPDRAVLLGPGRAEPAVVAPEAGLPPGLGGRHQARDVVGVLGQDPRGDQAGDVDRRVRRGEPGAERRRTAEGLSVRPRPGRVERRQARGVDRHDRLQPGLHRLPADLVTLEHDEGEPRLHGVLRRLGAERPGQLRPVELDVRVERLLGVGAAGRRVATDDLAGVDAQDVARPVERDVLAGRVLAALVVLDRHGDRGRGPQRLRPGSASRRTAP